MTKADKVRSATVQNRIVKTVVYCILTVYAFILLFPFYIILISALRPSMESYNVPFLYYIREFDVTGFVEIFTVDIYGISFVRSFFNTLLYVIPPTVVGLLVSAIAGFAFSKLRFPGKNVIFYGLLMTMMIPGTVTMIPTFMIFNGLNWIDTPLPLMIPGMFGGAGTIADPNRTAVQLNKYVKEAPYQDPEQSPFMSSIHFLKDDPDFEG